MLARDRFWLSVPKNVWGAYVITHNPSGRQYVGATGCMRQRWYVHVYLLSRGKHYARELQADWVKDGAEAFDFAIAVATKPWDNAALSCAERLVTGDLQPAYNQDGPDARWGRDAERWPRERRLYAAVAGLS